jgi:hypothetical protein
MHKLSAEKEAQRRLDEKNRRNQVCRRMVQKMLHAHLLQAWHKYVQNVALSRHRRELRRELAQTRTSDVLEAERERMRAEMEQHKIEHDILVQREQKREHNRRMQVCRRMVKMMLRVDLLLAWNTFVQTVALARRRRELVDRVLQRMRHLVLSTAFETFDWAVDQSIMQRDAVDKAIRRWRSQTLLFGFDLWMRFLELRRAEIKEECFERARMTMAGDLDKTIETHRSILEHRLIEQEEFLQQEKSWRIEICRRTVRRMLNGHLAAAFDHFSLAVWSMKKHRMAVARVISRLKNRSIHNAFQRLRNQVADQQKLYNEEAWLQMQNKMLSDLLAGTPIGKLLQENTLHEYALSEAAKV